MQFPKFNTKLTMKTQNNITKEQYEYATRRIEELLPQIHGNMPKDDPRCIEYALMSDIVEKYEQEHFPIQPPTIAEIIADALEDSGYTQKKLAALIGVSPSRVSEYISGKAEPTLKIAGKLCRVLNISPYEMLLNGEPVVYEEDTAIA